MTKPLRVLLLEDSEVDAELIKQELDRAGLTTVTQRVACADSFRSALREFAPDVVLSDCSLAQFNVRAALELLREVRPIAPLIIVTRTLSGEESVACLRAGAEDLILKENVRRLAASITGALTVRRPLEKLTPRQIEVLKLVAQGHRTREIAKRLQLSVKTVESHRGEVMKRLGVRDVVSLVHYAVRVGLISIAA